MAPSASSSDPTLEHLAHSVLQPGFEGTKAPDWVRRRVSESLGSVVLFSRNIESIEQVARLTASLRAENPDLIVAIDEEAGDVTRLEAWTGSSRPGNLALGAVDDIDLTERVAHDIGRDLHAAGVSLNFAPSADVNSNPLNPVIGVRSFGSRTDLVSRHTAAWIRGLQSAGVAACAKHFPGHGDTVVDSHYGLPQIQGSAEEIALTALPPFIAATEAGVRAVMTAHLLAPAYDPDLPATLSPRILVDLLRGELGFDGLLVTDGIEMGAVTDRYGIDGATVRAVAGGVDAVCVGGESAGEETVDLLATALVKAVLDGTLPEERLAEASARVRDFAAWSGERSRAVTAAGGDFGAEPGVDISRSMGAGQAAGTARSTGTGTGQVKDTSRVTDIGLVAARRAVHVRHGVGTAALPLVGSPHVVELSPTMNLAVDGRTPWGVAQPLRDLRPGTTSVRLTEPELAYSTGLLEREALAPATGRALVVVVRDAARHRWMTDTLTRLLRSRPDALVVEMGVPSGDALGAAHLITHGATRVSGIAAAELLVGATG
ncbi:MULTISPECIES: glycoside hydrolase family 3 protein [Streptomyces]|uniref:glycoside hydrolase family 3 protein n=1 Tax=Streptomyces TaxID=1883 RepID=UPI001E501BAE|nr:MULTISPECIES: glycoside hydrolase family 3 N-terminal domain-containing protein [Streptomyces]UFQ19255.1 glycoside hydrolase family 3 protein [Streptomyces huasconensis]WCL88874.1 glycoside hydrolase family 3 N-terminal domain-containing protein [Streptomyces sp. JCM 35825]